MYRIRPNPSANDKTITIMDAVDTTENKLGLDEGDDVSKIKKFIKQNQDGYKIFQKYKDFDLFNYKTQKFLQDKDLKNLDELKVVIVPMISINVRYKNDGATIRCMADIVDIKNKIIDQYPILYDLSNIKQYIHLIDIETRKEIDELVQDGVSLQITASTDDEIKRDMIEKLKLKQSESGLTYDLDIGKLDSYNTYMAQYALQYYIDSLEITGTERFDRPQLSNIFNILTNSNIKLKKLIISIDYTELSGKQYFFRFLNNCTIPNLEFNTRFYSNEILDIANAVKGNKNIMSLTFVTELDESEPIIKTALSIIRETLMRNQGGNQGNIKHVDVKESKQTGPSIESLTSQDLNALFLKLSKTENPTNEDYELYTKVVNERDRREKQKYRTEIDKYKNNLNLDNYNLGELKRLYIAFGAAADENDKYEHNLWTKIKEEIKKRDPKGSELFFI